MIKINENIKNDLKRWDKIGFIIISASISEKNEDGSTTEQFEYSQDKEKGDKKGKTNKERTLNLKKELKASGFSFKPVWGTYAEEKEDSFMVFPMKVVNGEIEEVDFDELYHFGKKLVKDYTQYSVHVHMPNQADATNDNGYGEVESSMSDRHTDRKSVEQAYASTLTKNPKKPSAKDHGWTYNDFTEIEKNHKLTDRDFEDVFSSVKK